MEKLIFCNLDMLKPELDEDDSDGFIKLDFGQSSSTSATTKQ